MKYHRCAKCDMAHAKYVEISNIPEYWALAYGKYRAIGNTPEYWALCQQCYLELKEAMKLNYAPISQA